ncbi:MAG: pyridoxamine 5'-phosphate oxidase family protein [Desulfobacteraceae bacterium]|jgi:hypothetical protein|nr:pyridoxamine 5'-phosphate oxidase family protein [Desulfobacteraceae bacterium]
MELKEYFETTKGTGVLSTADSQGRVDAAIYARPHFMEDGSVAFIMRDRLSHSNLQTNPYAAFLYIEQGPGYKGKRLFLKKSGEETETERLYELRRRTPSTTSGSQEEVKFLVFFQVEKVLPLVGPGKE